MDHHLIEKVIRGETSPELASEAALRFGRFSRDDLQTLDRWIIQAAQTDEADDVTRIRLSRFNHELSLRLEDESLIAQTSFTLLQMLAGRPAAVEERARLADFSLPVLEREGRPRKTMAMIYYHAAVAYFEAMQFLKTSERQRKAIHCGLRGLDLLQGENGISEELLLYNLHLLVGTTLNELPDKTEGDLSRSVEHLAKALAIAKRRKDRDEIGSTLNNLGNSLRLLGTLRGDAAVLDRAAETLIEALPYREDTGKLERTVGNLLATCRALEADAGNEGPAIPDDVGAKVTAGEQCLKSFVERGGAEHPELLSQAVEFFCGALSALEPARRDGALLRARAELGLGVALNKRPSGSEAALGVCYLLAARRRLERSSARERVAAADYNLGMAYSTILDVAGRPQYLREAAESLDRAAGGFEEIGAYDTARQSRLLSAVCLQRAAEAAGEPVPDPVRELLANTDLLDGDRRSGSSGKTPEARSPSPALERPRPAGRLRRILRRLFPGPPRKH